MTTIAPTPQRGNTLSPSPSPLPFSQSSPSPPPSPPPSSLTAAHEAVHLVMTNQFHAANAFFVSHNKEPRVCLLASLMAYLNGISSYSDADITSSLASIWATEAMARKALSSSSVAQEAIEGGLIQADCHMLGAMVQIVQQSYIKMVWNVRKSYTLYHEAETRIGREEALGDSSRVGSDKLAELKGWMQFGIGMFHLTLSLLPPTVLRVAEIIGYGGDRDKAFEYLSASQESPSFMAPFSCLLLLSYYLTISAFTGQEDPVFLVKSRKLLDAIDVAQAGLKSISQLPSVAIMFQYQSGWCALFLLEFASCARFFDSLLHSRLGGDYHPPKDTDKEAENGADGEEEDEEEEEDEVTIPPTKASAQALYAYQCGLCYALIGDFDRARWYWHSVPSWLTPQRKTVDMFASRKAAEILARDELRQEELTLDLLELFIAWNGLSQTPAASLAKLSDMLDTTRAVLPSLSRDDQVRYLWARAALTATTDPGAARKLIAELLDEHEKWLERSEYAKRAGTLAFLYYEYANVTFLQGELTEARRLSDKAKAYKGYDSFDILQLKLHALQQKIKRAQDHQQHA